MVGITLRSYAVFGLQTSIKENAWDSGIKLYPNPTGLSLYFQLPQALNITGVSVKNILGEEIPVIDYKSNDSFINTSHFPNGVYFVELNTEKGKFSQKFVVNH